MSVCLLVGFQYLAVFTGACAGPGHQEHPCVHGCGKVSEKELLMEKSKKELKAEIEQARRFFIAKGRRVQKLNPGEENLPAGAKPRKQRLKIFA